MATAKKAAKKTASRSTSKKAEEKNVLAGDLDSQEGVVTEVEEDEEESDVIVAESRTVGGQRGATKVYPPSPSTEGVKEKSRTSSAPAKADFDAAHKALDLAKELSDREVNREVEGDARATKRKLAAEDTTKFMIPFGIGEKHGAVETVTINGYRLSIKKGVLVDIPLTVASILMKHLDVRSDVAEKFALHRDEATEEALS